MKVFLVSKGSTGFDGLKRAERERPSPAPGKCSCACAPLR